MHHVATVALVVLGALLASGCVISRTPVFGTESRSVPFEPGTRFRIYERESSTAPWKREEKDVVLIASTDKSVRESDDAGKQDADEYTFYAVGADRYLVQARFGPARYAYGVLEIRGGEGYVSAFQCKKLDAAMVRDAGITTLAEDCLLDGVPDAGGFLKRLATRPTEALIKYVPVKKK
jgi:hypothetical protein